MKIEIEVPELPEGCAGACLGKDLPEGAIVTHYLDRNSHWCKDRFPGGNPWEGAVNAYTLPPYTQTLELPRPEPGYEWAVAKWDCGKDVFSRSFVHLHQSEKETK